MWLSGKKIHMPVLEMCVPSLGWEDPLEETWQPTQIFLPRESHGLWGLAGYNPYGLRESDMAEVNVLILSVIFFELLIGH